MIKIAFRLMVDVVVVVAMWSLPVAAAGLSIYGAWSLVMPSKSCAGEYLGRLGGNRFCGDCSANPWAMINNPYNPNSLTNRFGPYGNRFSPYSPNSRFATDTPAVYGDAYDEE